MKPILPWQTFTFDRLENLHLAKEDSILTLVLGSMFSNKCEHEQNKLVMLLRRN
jgi:hypothetical protein